MTHRYFVASGIAAIIAGIAVLLLSSTSPDGTSATAMAPLHATNAARTAAAPSSPMVIPSAWDGVDVSTGVSYGANDSNKLDIYQGDGKRPMPILGFIPGGGFVGGDKDT